MSTTIPSRQKESPTKAASPKTSSPNVASTRNGHSHTSASPESSARRQASSPPPPSPPSKIAFLLIAAVILVLAQSSISPSSISSPIRSFLQPILDSSIFSSPLSASSSSSTSRSGSNSNGEAPFGKPDPQFYVDSQLRKESHHQEQEQARRQQQQQQQQQQRSPFDDFFGHGSEEETQEHDAEPACNGYLCQETGTCVDQPLNCPCPFDSDTKCFVGDWYVCYRGDAHHC